MIATNLFKLCTLALVLTVVRSSAIPLDEAAMITLGSIVRQQANDEKKDAKNDTDMKNDTKDSNTTSPLPTVSDPKDNKTEADGDKKPETETEKPKEEADKPKEEADKPKEEADKKDPATTGDAANSTSGNSTAGNNTAPCFPATALVTLESGAQVRMSDLSIGDSVAVGNGKYSEVFMFTHRLSDVRYKFVEMTTSAGISLRATEGHYIYASGKYIAAGGVQIGDTLELADGSSTEVTSLKTVMDTGLYNPQTSHGDIIVNGVRASTFTTAIQPNFAHAALSPLRAVFARFGMVCTAFESGNDMAANSLPSGTVVA